MVGGWHRAVAGFGLAVGALLLTGCHAAGTFDVLSEDRVALDLVVSGEDVDCPNAVDALKLTITTITDSAGQRACHVTGETQATYFSPFGINVSRAAEYLVLQANLSGSRDDWPTSDIEIRFPGQVVSASRGLPVGNVVKISNLDDLAQGSGLRVVAIDRPGPPAWVIAAVAGTGAGIVLALIVLGLVWFARRRRPVASDEVALQPADAAEPTADEPAVLHPAPLHVPPGTRTVHGIGRPLETAPVPPTAPAPLAPTAPDRAPVTAWGPPGDPPDGPVDTSWFAAPPEPPPVEPEPAREPPPPLPDHSVWAPPRDRGEPAG